MSENGTKAMNFHLNCDSKGKTLILIETNEGIRIGGYTSLQWNMDGIKKYGENVFLISFQNNNFRKIPLIRQNKLGSIICDMNNGPSFDEFLVIKNNDLTKVYIENDSLMRMLGLSKKIFNIKELEVFQVNIKYN